MKKVMNQRICVAGLLLAMICGVSFTVNAEETWGKKLDKGIEKAKEMLKGKKTPQDDLKARIEAMQKSINDTKELFKRASASDQSKMIALGNYIKQIDASLKEVSKGGELHTLVNDTAKTAEALQKKYEKKILDPKLSPRTRTRYERLAAKYKKTVTGAYDRVALLEKTATKLEERKKQMQEDKDFFADAMRAKEMKEAVSALDGVITSMNSVSDAIDELAEGVLDDDKKGTSGEEQQ